MHRFRSSRRRSNRYIGYLWVDDEGSRLSERAIDHRDRLGDLPTCCTLKYSPPKDLWSQLSRASHHTDYPF